MLTALTAALVALVAYLVAGPGLPFGAPSCRLAVDRMLDVNEVVRRVDAAGGEAWAVGSAYVAAVGRPLALHRGEQGWYAEPVPTDAETETVGLHDVVVLPTGVMWAVGSVRAREPFAVRWAEGFTRVVTPDLGVDAEWLGVGASPAAGVWAVGKRTDGARYRTLIARADGDRFVVVPSPNEGEGNNVLADVDVAGSAAWTVGWSYGGDGRFHPLAMRLVDGGWEITPTPAPDGDGFLTTVVAAGDGTAWAVGWRSVGAEGARPLVLRYDGSSWTTATPPASGWARLLGADAAGSRLLVVGDGRDDDRRATPAAWISDDGSTWSAVAVGGDGERWFTGVDLGSDGAVVAAGASLNDAQRAVGYLATGC